jgi:hypothetical protein
MQHKDRGTRTLILEDRHLQNAAYLQENFIMRKKQYELLKFSSLVSVQSFRQSVIAERQMSLFAQF